MTINETSSLLPTAIDGNSRKSSPSNEFEEHEEEVAKMKCVTHNDPNLDVTANDYKNLLGSTRLLYNTVVYDEMTSELKRQSTTTMAANISEKENRIDQDDTNSVGGVSTRLSLIYNQQKDHAVLYLEKVKHSFFEDSKSLAHGTIPQSVVLALGTLCRYSRVLCTC
jgi:hypothetical protein